MWKYSLIGVATLFVAACGENNEGAGTMAMQGLSFESPKIERKIDYVQVSRGGRLFQQNCAVCHGTDGEGAPNWRQRDAEGFLPAPPLNGTGHAWHHPQKILHYVIKNGSPGGQGKMPAWGGELNDQQIEDIIAWFKSMWPQPVYEAWYNMNEKKKDG